MAVTTREALVAFEMGDPKHVSMDVRADKLSLNSFSFFGAQALSFDVGVGPGVGRFIRESHSGPGFSGFSSGVPHSETPRIDALVFGVTPGEVAVTSDILDEPALEEGAFEVERVGDLIVCEARFETDIPHSLGHLTVNFTTQTFPFVRG